MDLRFICPTPGKVPPASIISLVIQRKLLPPLFLRTDPRKHSQRCGTLAHH
jgi:hypothetical protein